MEDLDVEQHGGVPLRAENRRWQVWAEKGNDGIERVESVAEVMMTWLA